MKAREKSENIRKFNIIVVFSHSENREAPLSSFDNILLNHLFYAFAQMTFSMTYNIE